MRIIKALAAACLLVACAENPTGIVPEGLGHHPATLSISDALHSGGNEHFYFLPPMVSSPTTAGAFDPAVNPAVEVCAWNGGCSATVATFTTTSSGASGVRVSARDELYIANWNTNDFDLVIGATYRILVRVGGAAVGYADVVIAANGTQAKNLGTGDIIPLVDGRTLPIKFRIEQGMLTTAALSPNPATVVVGKTAMLSPTFIDAHGNMVTPSTIMWTSADASLVTVDNVGTVTAAAVGSASIAASARGVSAFTVVNVIRPPVASVVVTPNPTDVFVGAPIQLAALLRDADGSTLTDRVVSWSSSNDDVAKVDQTGRVSAISAGNVTITARSEGVSGTSLVEVRTPGLKLASIAAGDAHTCGLTTDGVAYCWGNNSNGQLGIGIRGGSSATPRRVATEVRFVQVSLGSLASCGLAVDGLAYCWGFNGEGDLGDGSFTDQVVPIPVATSLRFTQLSSGGRGSCGLATDQTAWCWGGNSNGLLGTGGNPVIPGKPNAVAGGRQYKSISNGIVNTCALSLAGAAYCWGLDFGGSPKLIAGDHTFNSISAQGGENVCALDTAGAAWCWGTNDSGEFGNGSATGNFALNYPSPVPAATGLTLVSIHSSLNHTCGRTTADEVFCWGVNTSGQLGNGSSSSSLVPLRVPGTYAFLAGANRFHNCAIDADGGTFCWGDNPSGQLGEGTTTSRSLPTRVISP